MITKEKEKTHPGMLEIQEIISSVQKEPTPPPPSRLHLNRPGEEGRHVALCGTRTGECFPSVNHPTVKDLPICRQCLDVARAEGMTW